MFETWVFGGFVMFVSAFLRTRSIHSPFSPVICVRLISVHGYFTAVTVHVRHEPSRIVAVGANLATRLGSSRPAIFSGVGVHYLKFTSAIPFRDMTSGVTVETVGNDSWRVATSRQGITIRREASPLLRPVTDRVYWTWVKILQIIQLNSNWFLN